MLCFRARCFNCTAVESPTETIHLINYVCTQTMTDDATYEHTRITVTVNQNSQDNNQQATSSLYAQWCTQYERGARKSSSEWELTSPITEYK